MLAPAPGKTARIPVCAEGQSQGQLPNAHHAATGLMKTKMLCHKLRRHDDVIVEKDRNPCLRFGRTTIERRWLARVRLLDGAQRKGCLQTRQHLAGPVYGTVHDDDHFEIVGGLGLIGKRFQTTAQHFGTVVGRDDDACFHQESLLPI